MWEKLHLFVLGLEILLIIIGALFVVRRNKPAKTIIFMCMVFLLNYGLYMIPWLHRTSVVGANENVAMNLLASMTNTIKQFVGEVKVEDVAAYTTQYPLYGWIFFTGAILAVLTTFVAAIGVFGLKLHNEFRVWRALGGAKSDLVLGCSDEALSYVKRNKNAVLLLDSREERARVKSLMEEGYPVLQKDFTEKFLNGRHLGSATRYHVLCLNEKDNISSVVPVILDYLGTRTKMKKIRFFVEIDDGTSEIVQMQVGEREAAKNQKATENKRTFREHITYFTRNELLAREFVEKNPITKHLPAGCITENVTLKPDTTLNVFLLGFGALSQEIYKQFILNNQLATLRDGEYHVLPLNYYIYDADADSSAWNIDGLRDALESLTENSEKYFPLPDMPYHTCCISERRYSLPCLRAIAEQVKQANLSYVLIDVGDAYKNILLANRLKLLLDGVENFCIYVRANEKNMPACDRIVCYGDMESVFTHEVIVNESLAELAREINKTYFKRSEDPTGTKYPTEEALAEASERNWRTASYFNKYSNIYLANNLRLKLQLLGLDYVADGKGLGHTHFPTFAEKEKTYENCLRPSVYTALLAQEHFRWNAYHLLNGYLPLKREKVSVCVEEKENEKSCRMKHKEPENKKHACLTTYAGLAMLSSHLAEAANQCRVQQTFTAESFEFYRNDGMLWELIPSYFAKKKYSVYKRS